MKNETKNSVTVFCIRLSLVVIALAGVSVCAFWYPFQTSLTAIGVPSGERVDPTAAQKAEYWIQLIFYWIASLPCFFLLIYGWFLSNNVKKNTVFSLQTFRLLRRSAIILFIDSIVFLVAQLVFTVLRWNPFAPILSAVGVIGLILSFALLLGGRYVKEAAKIKEENEGYI